MLSPDECLFKLRSKGAQLAHWLIFAIYMYFGLGRSQFLCTACASSRFYIWQYVFGHGKSRSLVITKPQITIWWGTTQRAASNVEGRNVSREKEHKKSEAKAKAGWGEGGSRQISDEKRLHERRVSWMSWTGNLIERKFTSRNTHDTSDTIARVSAINERVNKRVWGSPQKSHFRFHFMNHSYNESLLRLAKEVLRLARRVWKPVEEKVTRRLACSILCVFPVFYL